jgi:hypothetical protein
MTFWIYDCDHGQGSVEATTEEAARREAVLDAGRDAQVRNVRRPDADEMAFRSAMHGITTRHET